MGGILSRQKGTYIVLSDSISKEEAGNLFSEAFGRATIFLSEDRYAICSREALERFLTCDQSDDMKFIQSRQSEDLTKVCWGGAAAWWHRHRGVAEKDSLAFGYLGGTGSDDIADDEIKTMNFVIVSEKDPLDPDPLTATKTHKVYLVDCQTNTWYQPGDNMNVQWAFM